MIYCCEDCGFLFRRVGEIHECPSCESYHLRAATAQEADRLHELLHQPIEDHKVETTR